MPPCDPGYANGDGAAQRQRTDDYDDGSSADDGLAGGAECDDRDDHGDDHSTTRQGDNGDSVNGNGNMQGDHTDAVGRRDAHGRQRRSWSDGDDHAEEEEAPCRRTHRVGVRRATGGTARGIATVHDRDRRDEEEEDIYTSDDDHVDSGGVGDDDDDDDEPTAEDWRRSPAAAVAVGLRAEAKRLERLCRVNEAVWRQTESALQAVRYAIARLDRMAARGD